MFFCANKSLVSLHKIEVKGVTWISLIMSLPFWGLKVVMEGQKALRCHKKLNESLIGLERHEGGQMKTQFSFFG